MPDFPESSISLPSQRRLFEKAGSVMHSGQRPFNVFGAFHGAFCCETQYNRTADSFRRLGQLLIAIRSPIDVPGTSYEDIAKHGASVLRRYEHLKPRIIANSRLCNAAVLVPNFLEVASIDLVCGTIPATKAAIESGVVGHLPAKQSDLFLSGIEYVPGKPGFTQLSPRVARRTLGLGMPTRLADEMVAGLRIQTEREEDTILPEPLNIPVRAYCGAYDPVINPKYVKAASLALLGQEAIVLPTGHLPHMSHPKLFAQTLTHFARLDYLFDARLQANDA